MPRILVTRPQPAAEAFAREIAPSGWESVFWPATRIESRLTAPTDYSGVSALVFTSANGVRSLGHAPVETAYCVGARTAEAARDAGFAKVIDAAGDSRALVRATLAAAPHEGALMHVRGAHSAGDVAGALRAAGLTVRELIAYEAVETGPPPPAVGKALHAQSLHAAAFFSPRAAGIFRTYAKAENPPLDGVTAFAISANVAAALGDLPFARVETAAAPTGLAMRAAICGAVE